MSASHLVSDMVCPKSCAKPVPLAPMKATNSLAIGKLIEDKNSKHLME